MNKRIILPCSCHSFHFLTFEWYQHEKWDDMQAYIALGGEDWNTWRKRIKLAWHALRGGEASSVYEVVLLDEDVIKLRNELNEYLKEKQGNVAGF